MKKLMSKAKFKARVKLAQTLATSVRGARIELDDRLYGLAARNGSGIVL